MTLRWGICSVGNISKKVVYCMTQFLDPAQHQIVACAAKDLTRAKDFANQFGVPRAYDSYVSLAEDMEVDIVYIGTVHSEHHWLSLLFLEASKHVLCEKPCTMNLWQLKEVLAKAKQNKCFFMEAIWTRFLPLYKRMTLELDAKTIGEARIINAVMSCNLSGIPNREEPKFGGGGLLVVGIYAIQLMCTVFQEKPQKIIAKGHLRPTGVDDMVSLTLLYSGNRMGHLTSCISAARFHSTVIIGTKGTIELTGSQWAPTELTLPGETVEFPLTPNPIDANPNPLGFQFQAEAVAECIRQGQLESPAMTHADSILIKEILDEARQQLGVVYPQDKQ